MPSSPAWYSESGKVYTRKLPQGRQHGLRYGDHPSPDADLYHHIGDFVYSQDKFGRPYGWDIAEYTTPEMQLGPDFVTSAYRRKPEGSRERILAHLRGVLPEVPEKRLLKLI